MIDAQSLQHRRRAAAVARAFYDRRIDFSTFLAEIGQPRDPEVFDLVDMVTREPPVDGLGGVGPEEHRRYMEGVRELIERLSG